MKEKERDQRDFYRALLFSRANISDQINRLPEHGLLSIF